MNRIEFALTADDLIAAQRLYQLAGIKRQAVWVVPILGFALYLYTRLSGETDRLLLLIAMLAMVFSRVLVPLYSRFFGIPRMARRAIADDPAMSELANLGWDDQAIWAESETASWNQPMADLKAWLADDRVLLLFRQVHLFHIIPARAFPDVATRQALIAALDANGVSGTWPPR